MEEHQSMSIPIDRPSPATNALRVLVATLIFSLTICASGVIGWRSLTEVFSSLRFLCALSFSLAAAILIERK